MGVLEPAIRRVRILLIGVAIALVLVPGSALAGTYVLDEANIIDDIVEARIEALSARVEAATPGAEIAVVTVNTLGGGTIEEYAEQRFETLGIGSASEDNGVLLLVAPNERKVRIEVGYGLEGALPDALAGDIIDTDLTPRFREGDYSGGIEAGHARIAGVVADEHAVQVDGASSPAEVTGEGTTGAIIGLIITALIIGVIVFIAVRNRRGGGGDGGSGWWDASSWGSGGDSGGGWSDGGGFGGGDSGGGGASGDW